MNDALNSPSQERHPIFLIGILILFIVMGLILGQVIGIAAVALMANISWEAASQILLSPTESDEYRLPLLMIQACTVISAFIVAPLVYLQQVEKRSTQDLSYNSYLDPIVVVLTAIIMIIIIPFNSKVIEWNKAIRLPEWMSGIEEWAMSKEQAMEQVTLFLTDFSHVGEFLFAFLIIAVVHGIGEELVFRGLIQPKIAWLTNNVHAGIWITAFFFSFFHMQFYGFFPRMLLGALFGYLYIWSGNLVVPIIAHIVNNGFTVTVLYLMKLGYVAPDLESPEKITTTVGLFSALFTIALLVGFRFYYRQLEKKGQVPPPAYE
jgi:uncharacterized protein